MRLRLKDCLHHVCAEFWISNPLELLQRNECGQRRFEHPFTYIVSDFKTTITLRI